MASLSLNAERGMSKQMAVIPLSIVDVPDLVRLGRDRDGGYVVSRSSITSADALLSFGVSNDWSFERAFCAARPGAPVHAYDGSVSAGYFIKRAARSALSGTAHVATLNGTRARQSWQRTRDAVDYFRFFRGPVVHHRAFVSRSGPPHVALAAAIARLPVAPASLFLKMDIEGGEYDMITDLAACAHQFTGAAIEFHDLNSKANAFNEAMAQLSRAFVVAHVHGNNSDVVGASGVPNTVEITFLAKRLVPAGAGLSRRKLPDPALDRPCDPRKAELGLESLVRMA